MWRVANEETRIVHVCICVLMFVCVCMCVRDDACMNTYVVYDTYERQTRTLRIAVKL